MRYSHHIVGRPAILFVVAFFICLNYGSLTGFAFDNDYLKADGWQDNPSIVSQYIDKKSNDYSLNGIFKFYHSKQDNTLYVFFSVKENSISQNHNDIRITYKFTNIYGAKQFSVNKDGICDGDDVGNLYIVTQSFETYPNSDSGLYIAAVAIDNGCVDNTVDIGLYVNGHIYRIEKNINLSASFDETTSTTSLSSQNESNTQVSTTKAEKQSTTKNKKTSTTHTTEKATTTKKYKGNVNINNSASANAQNINEYEYQTTTTQIASFNQNTTKYVEKKMSKQSKIYLCVGGVIASVGVALIAIALVSKSKESVE